MEIILRNPFFLNHQDRINKKHGQIVFVHRVSRTAGKFVVAGDDRLELVKHAATIPKRKHLRLWDFLPVFLNPQSLPLLIPEPYRGHPGNVLQAGGPGQQPLQKGWAR